MAEQEGWTASLDDEVEAEVDPADVADAPPAQSAGSQDPEPFPMRLLEECPGLLGDVARWALENSTKRQPALVLGSAIASLGAVVGRRVATSTNLRTNFYILGIGETGCGKDASLKLPAQLLVAAGLHTLVGPSEWASAAGLRAALKHAPAHCCYIDEFAKLLTQMSGDRTPAHLANIRRYMLECFSSAGSTWQAVAYADRKLHDHEPMSEPHLCVYGTGVPAEAFTAMGRAGVADGFLNRVLLMWVDDQMPVRNRIGRVVPPAWLVQKVQALDNATRPTGNLAGRGAGYGVDSGCRTIPWEPAAEEYWHELLKGFDERIKQGRKDNNEFADLWVRAGEHVAKLALLRSVCDDPTRAISYLDVNWASEFVVWSIARTMLAAADRMFKNDYESDLKSVLRLIRESGANGVTSGDILRRFGWLRSQDLTNMLASLKLQGKVETVTTKREGPGRPRVAYVALLAPA
jgi:hypothetical protein